ncbi:MAG: diguanylate cyclase [Candidatus Hydrogenedentales bacterium]
MHLLVAEDDAVGRRVLVHALERWGYTVDAVTDGRAALEALSSPNHPFCIALMDWVMPELTGPEVCRELRARDGLPFVYLILLSSNESKKEIADGLDSGADDYLIKPVHPVELQARIRVGERYVRLQTELERANQELRTQALTDSLTQLFNRGAIMRRYEEELARAVRERNSLVVLMADIDHFKSINDTYGHPAGDLVLRQVAQHLQAGLRRYDVIGRYGGEEFLAVLPNVSEDYCEVVVERMAAGVRQGEYRINGEALSVTVSIGAAHVAPGVWAPSDRLLQFTDALLYQAKDAGRDRVVCAGYQAANKAISQG